MENEQYFPRQGVKACNTISRQQMFGYHTGYIGNVPIPLDAKITSIILKKKFKREEISSGISVTMDAFEGNLIKKQLMWKK